MTPKKACAAIVRFAEAARRCNDSDLLQQCEEMHKRFSGLSQLTRAQQVEVADLSVLAVKCLDDNGFTEAAFGHKLF